MKNLSYSCLILLIGLFGCGPDEIFIHQKPSGGTQFNKTINEITDIAIKPETKNPPEEIKKALEKPIVVIPQVQPGKSIVPKVMTVKKLYKECEPKCDKLENCNSDNGRCEGNANRLKQNYGWNPQKEHSEVFLVDSKIGSFSPGDEYLMRNR